MHDCEVCGLSFQEAEQLQGHMEQHLYDIHVENKAFDCENCQRSFFNIADFETHNQMVHNPY